MVKMRVHNKDDRQAVHAYMDILEDTKKIRLLLEPTFPKYLLTHEKLPSLIKGTIGKIIKEKSEITIFMPPGPPLKNNKNRASDKRIEIQIGVTKDAYLLIKTCKKTIQMATYRAWIETDEPPTHGSNSNHAESAPPSAGLLKMNLGLNSED